MMHSAFVYLYAVNFNKTIPGKWVDMILNAGLHQELGMAEYRRVRLLNILALCTTCMVVVFGISDIINGYYEMMVPVMCTVVFLVMDVYLLNKRKYFLVKTMSLVFFVLAIPVTVVAVGTEGGAQYALLPVTMAPVLIFQSKRMAVLFLVLIISAFVWIELVGSGYEPVVVLKPELVQPYILLNGIILILLIFTFTFYSRRINEDFEAVIVRQKEEIQTTLAEIHDSITYARRIQTALLPPARTFQKHLPDSFILYQPKDIVAGDFYWMESPPKSSSAAPGGEAVILFAAADCTGHGVPGAMVSVVCNNALNRAVREFGFTDPGKILDKTREIVVEEFQKSEEDVKDGMDISLVALSHVGTDGHRSLQWAGANNPLWIIRNGEVLETRPDKQPIGKYTDAKPFTTHTIEIHTGDTLYIFTDGFQDQFGGEKGKKFKAANLKQLLLSIQHETMSSQKEIIATAFENWRGTLEQVDDVCIIGVRV
jgi:serine phosphatase RsbU (regulator of sigma subunit)